MAGIIYKEIVLMAETPMSGNLNNVSESSSSSGCILIRGQVGTIPQHASEWQGLCYEAINTSSTRL